MKSIKCLVFKKNIKISILIIFIAILMLYIHGIFQIEMSLELSIRILAIIVISIMTVLLIFKKNEINKIKIHINGVAIPEWSNAHIEWNELKFELKEIKYFKIYNILRLVIHYSNKSTYIEYDYTDIEIFLSLIKQNCPKDHELYNLIEEYAKEKKLSF